MVVARIEGLDKIHRVEGRVRFDGEAGKTGTNAATRAPLRIQSLPATKWTDVPLDAKRGFRVALAEDATNLYLRYDVRSGGPLRNGGTDWEKLFKTGDGVDFQVENARLFITRMNGQPIAVLYRPSVPGTKEPVVFESPVGKVLIDRVEKLDAKVVIRDRADGYEVEATVPRSVLNIQPPARGDVGVLFADPTGSKTVIRHYWANKDTLIVDDLPTESRLSPDKWGWFSR